MIPLTEQLPAIVHDWPQFLTAGVLVLMRVSGLLAFAPIFGSSAIASRIKAGMAFAITLLLAPTVTVVPGARASLDASAILGELGIGMALGLFLMLLTESLAFAGMLIGMQFSFSLVNLLDPNTMIETPVLGQMLNWLGIMVLLHAGLDRSLLNALIESFRTVPVGRALLPAGIGVTLPHIAGTVFVSGLQLAAPVMAAMTQSAGRCAASTMACSGVACSSPRSLCSAKSIIMMAFFLTMPISMIMPTKA